MRNRALRPRRGISVVVGFAGALLFAALFGAVSPAQAQVGYPPGPCAVVNATADVGVLQVGQQITLTLSPVCVFTPGSQVTIRINGQVILTKIADARGFVSVFIVIEQTATGAQFVIDDPIFVPAVCGTNTIQATGSSRVASGSVGATATLRVNCSPTVIRNVVVGGGGGVRLAFTGANLVRLGAIALLLCVTGVGGVTVARRRPSKALAPGRTTAPVS